MSRRTLVPVLIAGLAVAMAAIPAQAKHKKPITKTYTVNLPVPNPAMQGACDTDLGPANTHREVFKAPEAGKLQVAITEFQGDFDMIITDAKGKAIAASDNAAATPNTNTTNKESATLKIKKAGSYQIVVCNFLASPSGTVKYTFTYAK